MTAGDIELPRQQLDAIAWKFLGSDFAGQIYRNWPLRGRLDAYLTHNRLIEFINDGSTYNALLDRVMANIGCALRSGVLTSSHVQARNGSPSRDIHKYRSRPAFM